MNKFIEELMEVTVRYGKYDGEIPEYEICELLEKHFGYKLDVYKVHGPHPEPKPITPMVQIMHEVYNKAIVDQLMPSNTVMFMQGFNKDK